MTNGRTVDFGVLFGAMWRVFASNYGILLGFTILLIAVGIGIFMITQALGFVLAGNAEPGALGPVMIALCINIVFVVVVMCPIGAYIHYAILRRGRSSTEERKPGRYGAILLLAIFQTALLCPGQFILVAANPGQFSNIEGSIKMLTRVIQSTSGDPSSQEARSERTAAIQEQQRNEIKPSPGLMILGFLALIIGALLAMLWFPWSFIAVLDPRNEARSAAEALRYGRELNAPVRASMYGAFIVAILIMGGSWFLCCLPGVFFGVPLLIAAGPAFYMVMGGESSEPTAPAPA